MDTFVLRAALARRILVLDGATATALGDQASDALVLSAPDRVAALHRAYLAAGADIVRTNTFNATRLGLRERALAERCVEINRTAAALARAAAAHFATPERPRWVAGVLGPTHRAHGPAGADELTAAYREAAAALIDGGADLLLIETVFDSRGAVAAVTAVRALEEHLGKAIPVMVSATVDWAGRLPSGEDAAEFCAAVASARPLALGFNCGFGASALAAPLRALGRAVEVPVSVHPNAGLPDPQGGYPDAPAAFAAALRDLAEQKLVNIVGGCCGTTPAHIAALATSVSGLAPRPIVV